MLRITTKFIIDLAAAVILYRAAWDAGYKQGHAWRRIRGTSDTLKALAKNPHVKGVK